MNVRIPKANISNNSFVVQWDKVNDLFSVNYTVRWYGEDGINGTATVHGLSYTVTGLTANTSFNITVFAMNICCGFGPVSDVIMAMTSTVLPSVKPVNGMYSCSYIRMLSYLHMYVPTYLQCN